MEYLNIWTVLMFSFCMLVVGIIFVLPSKRWNGYQPKVRNE